MTKRLKYFAAFCIFSITLFGCQIGSRVTMVPTSSVQTAQSSAEGKVSIPTNQPLPTHINLSPTQRSVINTSTPSPMLTVNPTSTARPTLTITPKPSITPMSDEERVSLIEDWLLSPPCPLPCWWGYEIGVDPWTDIEPVYKQMGARIHAPQNSGLRQVVFRDIPTSNNVDVRYIIEDSQEVEAVEVLLDSTRLYSLNHILTEYGTPDDVWLSAVFWTSSGDSFFQFVLAYWELGFAVEYQDSIGYEESESWTSVGTGCIEELMPKSLLLWNPAQTDANLAYLLNSGFIGRGHSYKRIEEVTDISPSLFFEEFVNTSESACVSTSIDLWN